MMITSTNWEGVLDPMFPQSEEQRESRRLKDIEVRRKQFDLIKKLKVFLTEDEFDIVNAALEEYYAQPGQY